MNKNEVVIEDFWYILDGDWYFIDTWPEDCKEIFKDIFNLMVKIQKY